MASLAPALQTGNPASLFKLAAWDANHYVGMGLNTMAAAPTWVIYTIYNNQSTYKNAVPPGITLPALSNDDSRLLQNGCVPERPGTGDLWIALGARPQFPPDVLRKGGNDRKNVIYEKNPPGRIYMRLLRLRRSRRSEVVTATDNRYTFYFNPVQALRMPNPAYWDGISRQSVATLLELMVEAILADTYPEAVGLSDAVNWQYLRNCHDYAWQPYMTDDFYSEGYVTQTEAWWTEDPTRNFTDGSMRFWCVSQGVYDGEYYFLKSDLDALKQQYQDVFGNLLQVPVCYNPGFFGFVPDHSG